MRRKKLPDIGGFRAMALTIMKLKLILLSDKAVFKNFSFLDEIVAVCSGPHTHFAFKTTFSKDVHAFFNKTL